LDTSASDQDSDLRGLAQAALSGGRPEAEQLFVRLLPRVRNLVRYLVRGDREVDDLSQEALVCVLKGLKTYRGDGPFRAWCDRVVARSVFARRKRLRLVELKEQPLPEEGLAAPDPRADAYALRRQLALHLDALPEPQRVALVLHHVVGMTVSEVARELQAPEETVRSRLRLGLERLRSHWAPTETSPSNPTRLVG
jgi:RNA polymerase sigma-70 factor, ECF subfamily